MAEDLAAGVSHLGDGGEVGALEDGLQGVVDVEPDVVGGVFHFGDEDELVIGEVDFFRAPEAAVDEEADVVKVHAVGEEFGEVLEVDFLPGEAVDAFDNINHVDAADENHRFDGGADFADDGQEEEDDGDHDDVKGEDAHGWVRDFEESGEDDEEEDHIGHGGEDENHGVGDDGEPVGAEDEEAVAEEGEVDGEQNDTHGEWPDP